MDKNFAPWKNGEKTKYKTEQRTPLSTTCMHGVYAASGGNK